MAGSISCAKGKENYKFQMEMGNVASMRETLSSQPFRAITPSQPAYIQTVSEKVGAPRGSVLSLDSRFVEQQSDVLPLTEAHLCRYEECMKFHSGLGSGRESQIPGSPIKNVFFYMVLIMLVVWILVYAMLNRLNYL